MNISTDVETSSGVRILIYLLLFVGGFLMGYVVAANKYKPDESAAKPDPYIQVSTLN